jgi:hypothetical protein
MAAAYQIVGFLPSPAGAASRGGENFHSSNVLHQRLRKRITIPVEYNHYLLIG